MDRILEPHGERKATARQQIQHLKARLRRKPYQGTEEKETFAADEQRGQFEHGLGESLSLAGL